MKYLTDVDLSQLTKEEFDSLKKIELKNKDVVLKYMKSVKANVMTTFVFSDVVTGKEITWNLGHNDGEFMWFDSEIYYFEKYNVEINEEFVEKAVRSIGAKK